MRKPPYKPLTREKLMKKVSFMRKMIARGAKGAPPPVGKLITLPTDKGNVNILAYGFENTAKTPLLVNIHGGGFVMGTAANDDPYMMQFVEKCGIKVINVDYSLSPEVMFPVAIEECRAAIIYMQQHADEYHIDPERIITMGHSAGGNFCAAMELMDNDEKLVKTKGTILDYPPTDILTDPFDKPMPKGCIPPKMARNFNAAYCTEEQAENPLVSPTLATIDQVKNFPPTLVITAGSDSLANETIHFADTLEKAGVDVTRKHYEGVLHGFTMYNPVQAKRQPNDYKAALDAWQIMIDFVNKYI